MGLMVTLGWPDILVGPGLLGGAIMLSFEQLVIDIEIFRLARQAPCRRAGRATSSGSTTSSPASAPGARSSASRRRGATYARGEWLLSDFGNRDTFETWQAAGGLSTVEAARARVEEILAVDAPAGPRRRPAGRAARAGEAGG